MMKKIFVCTGRIIRWIRDKFTRHHDALEIILLAVTIVIAYILFDETHEQTETASKALTYQREKDSIQRYNDSLGGIYQRKKDSATLDISKRSLDLTAKIAQTTIQPFLFVDSVGLIENLIVPRIPSLHYRIRNSGPTPAYSVVPKANIIWESQYEKNVLHDPTRYEGDASGFILGRDNFLNLTVWYFNGSVPLTEGDSINFWGKSKSLLFICTVVYDDPLSGKHYTQQGFILTPNSYPSFIGLRKYTRTEHSEKNKTTTQTH